MRISQFEDTAAPHSDQPHGAPKPIVNNFDITASPQTPLHGSASVLDRRGARAKEHAARPPARFSSLLSQEFNNQKQTPCRWHGQKKVPNQFQDLTTRDHLVANAEFRMKNGQKRVEGCLLLGRPRNTVAPTASLPKSKLSTTRTGPLSSFCILHSAFTFVWRRGRGLCTGVGYLCLPTETRIAEATAPRRAG